MRDGSLAVVVTSTLMLLGCATPAPDGRVGAATPEALFATSARLLRTSDEQWISVCLSEATRASIPLLTYKLDPRAMRPPHAYPFKDVLRTGTLARVRETDGSTILTVDYRPKTSTATTQWQFLVLEAPDGSGLVLGLAEQMYLGIPWDPALPTFPSRSPMQSYR